MASTHNLTYEQFIAWASPLVATAAGRAEVRRALVERVGWANDTPDQKQAQHAIKLLGAENFNDATLAELTELSSQASEAITQQENEMTETTKSPDVDIERVREMIKIERADPELRRALLRNSKEGLTPRQAAQFDEYKSLETANNEQAYRERAVKTGTHKGARPHMIPSKFYELERIADPRERTHAIRELRAQMRDDKASPYNNASHPEHRAAVEQMTRLYRAEEELGPQPEDGE